MTEHNKDTKPNPNNQLHKNYLVSGKEYLVKTPEELLERIKKENSHTKDLSLQSYMDKVAANAINSLTQYKIDLPVKAADIVEIWKKIGIAFEK